MLTLRPYQLDALSALYGWFNNNAEGDPVLVLPTGSGKSLIAAKICEDALQFPNQRILLLTHVRELISQNFQALVKLWPEAPAGIYSAGLNKRQSHHQITFAGIQSVYKKANLINWRDLIIIDECHLISDSDSGMYRTFLAGMKRINPHMRVIGLSATPYRMKSGYLHKGEGAIFSDIAFDLSITRLVQEGYLSPLVSKAAVAHGNTDKLAIQAGEFSVKEALSEFDNDKMTQAAIEEMLLHGRDRKTFLVFCITIDHAEHVRDKLIERGIKTETISEKTPKVERDRILLDFKKGHIQAITNVSVLTTGFDAPNIDMICLLRPTMSPGLLTQMCGRGMRLSPGKENCLVLDFAQNLERHGPITHIVVQQGSRKNKEIREGKICPKCRTVCAIEMKECADCGHIFEGSPRKIKHATRASSAAAMSSEPTISSVPQWLNIKFIRYDIHTKIEGTSSLKVTYKTDAQWVLQWHSFGHPKDFPRQKAEKFWIERGGKLPYPRSAQEAMSRIQELSGYTVRRIKVKKNGKFDDLVAVDLIRSTSEIKSESGNLGSTFTQEIANVTAQAV